MPEDKPVREVIEKCESDGKPGYRYPGGKCYTYEPNNEDSRNHAKKKAVIQGIAIRQNNGE